MTKVGSILLETSIAAIAARAGFFAVSNPQNVYLPTGANPSDNFYIVSGVLLIIFSLGYLLFQIVRSFSLADKINAPDAVKNGLGIFMSLLTFLYSFLLFSWLGFSIPF